MTTTSAAVQALRVLKANGITRVFGNPGTTELALLDGIVSEDMEFVLGLNEGVCTSMADGYARATGQVGVVLAHTSVGTANTVMNAINARADRAPLLLISGDKDERLLGRGHFCEVPDIGGLLRQVTKQAWRVPTPDQLPELVFRGLQCAAMAPTGPVFLSVPENLLGLAVSAETDAHVRPIVAPVPGIDAASVDRLLDALASAERPLIVAGNGIGAAGAREVLAEISTRLSIPVVTEAGTANTRSNFPARHANHHGAFAPTLEVVRRADLVVAFGAHLFREYEYPSSPWLPAGTRLIQIDSDTFEINKLHAVETAIFADAGAAARALAARLQAGGAQAHAELKRRRQAWALRREEHTGKGAFCEPARVPPDRMLLGDLVDGIGAALPEDGVLVDESVMSKVLLQRRLHLKDGQDYIGTSSGGLGWGIGASMGVQMGWPDRRVAALVGDGGTLFAVQGLWTAARYGLAVVFVIVDNGGYMAVRRGLGQIDGAAYRSGRYPASWIDRPEIDLPGVARAFGIEAMRCGDGAQIADVLRAAFALERPVLVDARVTSEEFLQDPA